MHITTSDASLCMRRSPDLSRIDAMHACADATIAATIPTTSPSVGHFQRTSLTAVPPAPIRVMSVFNAPARPVVRSAPPPAAAPAPNPTVAAPVAAAVPSDAPAEKDPDLKIILLGDSAVGKSKLVERFLMNDYVPRQMSTYALTVFRHKQKGEDGKEIEVDFWVSR
jgi:hypothetical protein